MSASPGYYRHPTIHRDKVVFVSEDDLWSVPAGGGVAHRLTANPGSVTFPALSPDGAWVAFTSKDEGHPEAWVMDVDGGPPRRLTYLGGNTQVAGWRSDGAAVIVASDWGQPFAMFQHLLEVPAGGGVPRQLALGPARAISFQPGGPGIVIGRNSADPARWKRYRGGTAGTIWIDRTGDGEFEELLRLPGNLAGPMWIGRRIYFLSDHEGTGNLYSCTPTGRGLTRLTHHEDFYARFPSTDGRRIVYHAGADLHLYDTRTGEGGSIEVSTPSARPQRNRRFIAPGKYLESVALHPKGHSVALVARGGAFTMPLWEGAPLRHGTVSKARYRLACWLADGERLVAVTDGNGEEALVVMAADGSGSPREVPAAIGRPGEMAVAPAGADRVALSNQRQEVVVVDLGSKNSRVVHHSRYERIQGLSWSPDGRWLAFAAFVTSRNCVILVHDSQTGRTRSLTRPDFVDVRPSFDPEGRYLYFLSRRVFDPVYDGHYHDYGFPKGVRPCLLTLRADEPSPFDLAQREPRPPGSKPQGAEGDEKPEAKPTESEEPSPVEIDFAGIEDRVVALPVPEARYGRVLGASGRVLFSSFPVEGALGWRPSQRSSEPKGKLESYDFSQEKVEAVTEGISDFDVSMDGKVLAITAKHKVRVVAAGFKEADKSNEQGKPGRESGWLDLSRVRVEVVPGDEWQQMFREAWRLQRDQFWTPDMGGVDWEAVRDRYLPLIDRVAARSEFSDLMWEVQGELGTSHAYELGGDYRPEPAWRQGFLGADLERTTAGGWRVARIPRGDGWEEEARSPLAAPGVGIRRGDRLLAVDGHVVDGEVSPQQRLVDRAARTVLLTVRSGRRKPRTVAVTALKQEHDLRYRDWVEANREQVHGATGDRVGYLHIPDMGARGFAEFHRYFPAEALRDGLIVDVRHNRGGNVSALLLEKLLRRRIGYGVTRYGEPDPYPEDAPMGPMVALTDEYSGSDGDIFSHAFKLYRLGPLIGKRTWGGVIGVWPRHALVDGTVTTQPEFAHWFEDVGWGIENYGTDPDLEVDITPQDAAAGRDPQLERGITEILRIVDERQPAPPDFAAAAARHRRASPGS